MLRSFLRSIGRMRVIWFLLPMVFASVALLLIPVFPWMRFLLQLFALACGYWLIVFLCWSLRHQRGMRVLSRICLSLLLLFLALLTVLFIVVEVHILANDAGDSEIPETAQVLIVLGCQVEGETPSRMLEHRLSAALEYLNANPQCIAILSGGQGEGEFITEAQAMYLWLTDRGVSPRRLIREASSVNTDENIDNSLACVRSVAPNATEVVIVSTGFHLFRGKTLCRWGGYEAYGLAGEMPGGMLFRLNWYCREFASVFFMYGREIFA